MELFNYMHNDEFFFAKTNDILRRYKSSDDDWKLSFRWIRVDFYWRYIDFDNLITSDGYRYESFIEASKYAQNIPNFYFPSHHYNNVMIAGWYKIGKNINPFNPYGKSASIKYSSHITDNISDYYNFTHSLLINKIKKKWKMHFWHKLSAIIFIQNRWCWIVSCPRYQLCRSRLFKEIDILNDSHFIC